MNQVPEGYTFDEASGLYYSQEVIKLESGGYVQKVDWFNAETNTHTLAEYPVKLSDIPAPAQQPVQQSAPQPTQQPAPQPTQQPAPQPVQQQPAQPQYQQRPVQPQYQQPVQSQYRQPVPPQYRPPVQQQYYPPYNYAKPKKKSSTGVIVALIVILFLAAIAVILFVFKDRLTGLLPVSVKNDVTYEDRSVTSIDNSTSRQDSDRSSATDKDSSKSDRSSSSASVKSPETATAEDDGGLRTETAGGSASKTETPSGSGKSSSSGPITPSGEQYGPNGYWIGCIYGRFECIPENDEVAFFFEGDPPYFILYEDGTYELHTESAGDYWTCTGKYAYEDPKYEMDDITVYLYDVYNGYGHEDVTVIFTDASDYPLFYSNIGFMGYNAPFCFERK